MIFDLEADSRQHGPTARGRVFLSAGSEEVLLGDIPMVANTRAMYERLAARADPGLEASFALLDGEMHYSTIPAAVSRGLRWLYR